MTEAVAVTGNYYKAEELIEYLGEHEITLRGVYRTHYADALFEDPDDLPDVVLGDYTCKERVGCNEPLYVFYNTRQKAHEAGVRYLPLWLPKFVIRQALK